MYFTGTVNLQEPEKKKKKTEYVREKNSYSWYVHYDAQTILTEILKVTPLSTNRANYKRKDET